MSPKHKIMDYGRVWISAHVGVCMPARLCVVLRVHTHMHTHAHTHTHTETQRHRHTHVRHASLPRAWMPLSARLALGEATRVCGSSDHVAPSHPSSAAICLGSRNLCISSQ